MFVHDGDKQVKLSSKLALFRNPFFSPNKPQNHLLCGCGYSLALVQYIFIFLCFKVVMS